MSLGELTGAADVSVRTVRYYIAEGLLPPPLGAGPGSAYTRGHLDRLQAIQQLKEAYLPLKEIRRRLAGLDDGEIRTLLAAEEREELHEDAFVPSDASLAGAREYLAMMETRERYRTEPMALQMPPPAPPSPGGVPEVSAPVPASPPLANQARTAMSAARGMALARQPAPASERPESQDQELWRRIPLGDEAELVISDRVYGRHRDRIDWLVRWARKVFN